METSPLPLASGAQGSAVVASPTSSMWQAAATSLRSRLGIEENRRCRGYLWHDLVTAMITTIDKIRADAFNEDELLHCAFVDATDALCRLAVNGRTTVESIRIPESWRSALETAERRRTHEKARRA
jgi:hypothetical protein